MTMALAGELSGRQPDLLGQHLERCQDCRREWEAYAALDRALGTLPLEAALPARLEQVTLRRVRLADGAEAPQRRRRWLDFALPALAATAVLVVAVRLSLQVGGQVGGQEGSQEGRRKDGRVVSAPAAPARAPSAEPQRLAARTSTPAPTAAASAGAPRRAARVLPTEPPPELTARPDLFVNLRLLRNLDKLQHYEAIQTISVDGQNGRQSSG